MHRNVNVLAVLTLNHYSVRSASGTYHSDYLGEIGEERRRTRVYADLNIRFDDRDSMPY